MNITEAMQHSKETGSVMRSKSTDKEFWYCETCEVFLFPDQIMATDWEPAEPSKRQIKTAALIAKYRRRPNPKPKMPV